LSQVLGWLLMASPKAWPEVISGRQVPRICCVSVKSVSRPPSAKREDQVPMGTTPTRPLGFNSRTMAPSVSRWATMARAGCRSRPLSVARMAPRRVMT
jgi:hypothetical protein